MTLQVKNRSYYEAYYNQEGRIRTFGHKGIFFFIEELSVIHGPYLDREIQTANSPTEERCRSCLQGLSENQR